MSDLAERLEARLEDIYLATELIQEAKGADGPKGGYVTDHLDAAENHLIKVRESLVEAAARIRELEAALKPFAAMGRLIDARATITFGKRLPDHEVVLQSSGEVGHGILVMGHFRDATALLPDAPGWSGVYRMSAARQALGGGNG